MVPMSLPVASDTSMALGSPWSYDRWYLAKFNGLIKHTLYLRLKETEYCSNIIGRFVRLEIGLKDSVIIVDIKQVCEPCAI